MRFSVCVFLLHGSGALAAEMVEYEKDIRPIFEANCYQCHGADKQKGNLRLDTPAGIRRGGDSGEPLFVLGKRGESYLFRLVSREDPGEAMPPKEKDALSKADVAKIGLWIDQGAKLPGKEEVARLSTDHWSFQPVAGKHKHGSVDGYLREALASKGLQFSSRADRRTLIRRLYLVMLGLPPSPEEVEGFLRDKSPEAWSALVEKVLASPHYGERMARHWLDIVRFAETNGFETNRERLTAYRFRDYVIESFNEDKPYDRFVKEHLAGDALGADIGTGFLVAGPHDIVKSPDPNLTLMQRQDELADMINTTGTAFLGLTLGCARCHNHKFDPVAQKDYYALQAVFAGVGFGERALKIPRDEKAREKVIALRREVAGLEAGVEQLRKRAAGSGVKPARRPAVTARGNVDSFPATIAKFVRFTIRRTNSSQPCIDELEVFTTEGENVARGGRATSSGNLPGYEIHKLEHINDGKYGNGRSWISNENGKGWVQIALRGEFEVNRIEWARDREGRFADRVATDYTIELSRNGTEWKQVAHSGDREPFGGKSDPEAFIAALPKEEAERARALLTALEVKRRQVSDLETGPKSWVARFSQPGATHRLYRGDPMARREEVGPDALPVISSLGLARNAPERERREALAHWIASPENPLTARVAVNRLWQFVFGTGLVDTPSDFGANGTRPTHPGLLDWLSAEFVSRNWSVKETMRLLLNSQAFQQASGPSPHAHSIDADSRLLWRFPPRRLEAEAIRDGILSAAGTLDRRMGGPGFYLFEVDRENVVHYHAKEECGPEEWRRMIYMFKIRQEQDSVFGAFDCPDGNQAIPKRSRSTTPLQALNLLNSHFTMQQAGKMAERLGEGESAVREAYRILYGRPASREEVADALGFVNRHGMVAFCRAMLNTNEFLFVF